VKSIWRQKNLTLVLTAILLLPLAPLGIWSFANLWQYPQNFPQEVGFNGWENFFSTGGASAIAQSMLTGFFVTVVVVPLSFMAAQVITRSRGRTIRIVEGILFLPLFLPPFVLVIGVTTGSIVINIPAKIAVVATLSVLAMPYTTFIFRSAFLNYRIAWEEEGELLGASNRQLLIKVRLPMLRNSILAASLIAFLIGWSDYIVTLIVGGGQILTLPLLIGASSSQPGNDSALAVMSIVSIAIPVLVVGVLQVFTKKENKLMSA